MAATLTPDGLDRQAARLVGKLSPREAAQFDRITTGFQRTAPSATAARRLLTKTVDELVAEALATTPHGTRPAVDVRLPGKVSRSMPHWAIRRKTDITHTPATQLLVAATILREWGWQQKPHRLRNGRGQRCVCGALCTAVDALGIGTRESAHQAAGHVLAELRDRGWPHLIGDWNQQPGRTAQEAIDLTLAAHHRATTLESA